MRFCTAISAEQTIADLRSRGRRHDGARRPRPAETGKLAGKTLVVTGTLAKYSRDEIEELIAAARRPGGVERVEEAPTTSWPAKKPAASWRRPRNSASPCSMRPPSIVCLKAKAQAGSRRCAAPCQTLPPRRAAARKRD